jgi:hypothetical protein
MAEADEGRTEHRTLRPCRHCGRPFVSGEHWPQGTVAYRDGQPYRWHEYEPEPASDTR